MDLELKSLFIRLTAFAGLFFASSIPAVGGDGGAAGGDEGGGAGGDGGEGGDDGSESGDTAVSDEGDAADEGADDTDGESDVEADQEGEEGGEEEGEGTGGDKSKKLDLKKELDKLRKTNPRLASELRKEHFSNQDFRRAFATPVEAQAAADVLNLVGGEEGISAIQAKADDFANELTMVAEGNPQILDDIVRDTPDGFKKLMGAGLEKLRLLDQAAYERYTAKPLSAALREKGVINTLEMIRQMALAGKGQEVFDLTQKLLNWAASVEDFAKHTADEAPSDREKSADAKIKQAEQIARKGYLREVGTASNRATNSQIKRYIDPLIRDAAKRGVKLNTDQLADLSSGVYTEIANSLKQNTAYQRQMEAYYAKNADPDEIANYVKGKVSSLAEGAAKKVWGRKGWAVARGNRRNGDRQGNERRGLGDSGQAIFVSKPPEPQNIDWSKDPQRMRFMGDGKRGEATLRTGKVVRFRWDT